MPNDDDFESLYRSYDRVIGFFMRSFRLTKQEAEDLTQETFLRVWKSIGTYRGGNWAFLEMTARRIAYNRFRKSGKREGLEESIHGALGESLTAQPGPDPVELLDRAAQARQLRDAIEELPGTQRDYLKMLLAGFSYPEIAAFFKTNQEAVKSRLRDARSNLRKRLGAAADLLQRGEE